MKLRGVVGKRIKSIRQRRKRSNAGMVWDVEAIVLEDGTVLLPNVAQWRGNGYLVEFLVVKDGKVVK
jgi:hypothetical protein